MPTRMLPSLTIVKSVPRNADVLVVGMSEAGVREVPEAIARAFAKRFGVSVGEMVTSLGAKASADSKRTLPAAGDGPRIVVVGLESEQPSAEDLRRAAGVGVRHAAGLAGTDGLSVAVSLGIANSEQLAAVAEGALLGSYDYEPISAEPAKGGTVDAITVIHSGDVKGADIATIREDRRAGGGDGTGAGQYSWQPAVSGVVCRAGARPGPRQQDHHRRVG